ncbi:MAG TPA: DUF1223 domain-containing protein [Hanamia sp.]|nr:DUF1223 domain-containing protein [Hanamia sp.]
MKRFFFLLALPIPVFTLWCCTSSTAKEKAKLLSSNAMKSLTNNVAVLELFTSQGCSSCPPADKLIGTYTSKTNVIPLSFHVDYWDRLGWKDPFSSKEYSRRQYMYASALKAEVYTPQLIINGQAEMVGSNAGKISSTLIKIFSEKPDATLAIQRVEPANGKINIKYNVAGNTQNSLLNIAVIEKKTVTPVKTGENGGATLTDYNVVRNFKTIDSIGSGENMASIDIPSSVDPKNMAIVLFLQEKGNNKITAADRSDF